MQACPVTGSDVEPCALEDAERGVGVEGEPVVDDRSVELGAACSRVGSLEGGAHRGGALLVGCGAVPAMGANLPASADCPESTGSPPGLRDIRVATLVAGVAARTIRHTGGAKCPS